MIAYLLNKIQKAKETKKNSKGFAFWATTVAATLGLLVAAYYAYQLFSGNSKLAKARHQRDVLQEEKMQAKVNVKVAKNAKEKTRLRKTAKALNAKVHKAQKKVHALEKSNKENKKTINRIKDWDDVKTMVKYSN